MTNKLEISRATLTIAMRLVVQELETLANGSAIQRHKAALEELRAQLNQSVTPNVIPAACTHGAYDDDAACMDCLKAWGQYPFAAPAAPSNGGRSVPYSSLCYGAKFTYTEGEAAVWVKVGHNVIAGWKAEHVATNWVAQPLCSFSEDDDDVSAPVWLIDEGSPV